MIKKYNKILKYSISTISIIFFLFLVIQNLNEFKKLKIDLLYFLIFVISFIFRHFALTYVEWKMLSNLKVKVNFYEYLIENNLANLINITSPLKVGAGKKLLFLKENFNVKTVEYFAIFTTLNIHLAVIFFTIFFFGLLYINLINFQLIYIYLVSLLIILYIINKFKKSRIFKLLIIENYLSWKNQKIFWSYTFWILVSISFGILQTYFLILAIFQFENLIGSLFINSATFFANIIQLSPGNIGFLELIYFSLDKIINLNSIQIIIYSSIIRVTSISIFLLLNLKKI